MRPGLLLAMELVSRFGCCNRPGIFKTFRLHFRCGLFASTYAIRRFNMATDIGVGIIGFGLAAKVFHAPFVSAVPGLKLVAFVERKSDDAHKVYPETKTVRTVEDLLADPEIQLVVVATPNETHYSLAKQA